MVDTGHSGIPGNTTADRLANEARKQSMNENPRLLKPHDISKPITKHRYGLTHELINEWQRRWELQNTIHAAMVVKHIVHTLAIAMETRRIILQRLTTEHAMMWIRIITNNTQLNNDLFVIR